MDATVWCAESAAYPQRITYIADVGYSYNTSSTLEHVLESQLDAKNPPIAFLVGDYAYAGASAA